MIKNILLLLLITNVLQCKVKSIWLPIWEITTADKIETAVNEIASHGFNEILVQVRYRGDAAYTPNKFNDFYKNPEKLYHAVEDSLFDPLEYTIDVARKLDIEVHAWIPTFVITGHKLEKLHPNNPYFSKPEWITIDNSGKKMDYQGHQGAFLDPGIPEVQDYTENIIMDIVSNYDVDGIHLDYIRYPDSYYGHNILAKNEYRKQVQEPSIENWQEWKQVQITQFVEKIYLNVKEVAPIIEVSAAVFADINIASNRYSQNWMNWLEKGIIDEVYLMEYTTSTTSMETHLNLTSVFEQNDKIVVGLRAWSTESKYPVKNINEKIELLLKTTYAGYALFSYTGIIGSNYFITLELGE